MKHVLKESLRSVVVVVAALLVAGGVAMAQVAFVNPTVAAPGGNIAAPVHPGAGFQDKAGNVVAGAVGTNNGFCIGTSCVTTWTQLQGSCVLERKYASEIPHPGNYGDACNNKLSAQSKSQGWVGVSSDTCAEDYNKCGADAGGLSCVYTRITCGGVPVVATNTTMTADTAKTNGFFGSSAPVVPPGTPDDDVPIDYDPGPGREPYNPGGFYESNPTFGI